MEKLFIMLFRPLKYLCKSAGALNVWTIVATVILVILQMGTVMPLHGQSGESDIENVIFILSDDHRYDFMSFMEKSPDFLDTPAMDRMAREGAHIKNAFVTTSICSPSRASILTGQYAHRHGVVDNQRLVPEGTRFFPEFLQNEGMQTAFIGKWHMGHERDDPRPGFDHWVSFRGQGAYFDPVLNINGERSQHDGYIADILTDHAIDWLETERDKEQPFFLYLSHKNVHYEFKPAPRHEEKYAGEPIDYPEGMARTEGNLEGQSQWMYDRRYSIHGIEHMWPGNNFDNDPVPDFDSLYHRYAETTLSLDESIGEVLSYLDENDLAEETLVIYMGDNGFYLGEHGFYDKRDAFEPSIRVPLLAYAPGTIEEGTVVDEMVLNLDVAPTILDAAGMPVPEEMEVDGSSFLPLLQGKNIPWREEFLYEYFWEWNFPATPTMFALRGNRYKYIFYYGRWDKDGFYDLKTDPHEQHNLIDVPSYQDQIARWRERLFDKMEESGAMNIPLRRPQVDESGKRLDMRLLDN
ncbi:N-acetylglucosamine-6-sulfatase [Fodinibius roseus]|uniref:N-acetylglucosamine-6-sulfatase n=2 Tax=Fodinibius roseus TaxID=1194090 RepID=A0A1M4TVT1_9BACT|nr:N-acetylglucosamine-6-sulfatase [Fodinibius roseus]